MTEKITGWFPPMCPECKSGKHRNCTGWTLDDSDAEIDCECPECQKEGTQP